MSINLSPEQKCAFELFGQENIFLTGGAGTGKTTLLKTMIESGRDGLFVTASTGIAALAIGGSTLHAFAGVGYGQGSIEDMVSMIRKNKRTLARWNSCRILIIDEISMVSGEFLDRINEIAKAVRFNSAPFGGINVCFSGDFLQLPPVKAEIYAFQSNAWKELSLHVFNFENVFRQENAEFVKILNELRYAKISPLSILKLQDRLVEPDPCAINLVPTNSEADEINDRKLDELAGEEYSWKAEDKFDSESHHEQLKKICLAPEILTLKVGARVMLLTNLDLYNNLANGSLGTVISLTGPIVKFDQTELPICVRSHSFELKQGNDIMASRDQLPLRLAWAITIHKSQGMTLHKVNISIGACFEKGQAYVALSRASTLEGLTIKTFSPGAVKVSRSVVEYYRGLRK